MKTFKKLSISQLQKVKGGIETIIIITPEVNIKAKNVVKFKSGSDLADAVQ